MSPLLKNNDYKNQVTTRSFQESTRSYSTIETLISFIYLTDNFVYKTKKPVNFGFCDFRSLKDRRKYCLLEYKKNCLLSPSLYKGVFPVKSLIGKTVGFGKGVGAVVDYCVKMRRIEEKTKLKNLLEKKAVTSNLFSRIGQEVGIFHQRLKSEKKGEFGSLRTVKNLWRQNFEQVQPFIGVVISKKDFEKSRAMVEDYLEVNAGIFESRKLKGFVKDAHGDLHSENIFVEEVKGAKTPVIFDALEFNKELSCLDVAGDLSFLTMDLKFTGNEELSKALLQSYLKTTGDKGLLENNLISFYEAYRAFVRGKILALLTGSKSISAHQKKRSISESKKYLKFAIENIYNYLGK